MAIETEEEHFLVLSAFGNIFFSQPQFSSFDFLIAQASTSQTDTGLPAATLARRENSTG